MPTLYAERPGCCPGGTVFHWLLRDVPQSETAQDILAEPASDGFTRNNVFPWSHCTDVTAWGLHGYTVSTEFFRLSHCHLPCSNVHAQTDHTSQVAYLKALPVEVSLRRRLQCSATYADGPLSTAPEIIVHNVTQG
ncbi:hypothetical protein GOODEAATRI_002794 [Goodea atripinnis]|uniref:Uncharacterized protein n=1 Tax=Goodea atripinnis TaxID=208336 RepID=A0ABV0N7C9_9TELE